MASSAKSKYPQFSSFIARKRQEYGSKFSMADLDMKFVPYYGSDERIKVKYGDEVITGTVGVTTGWKPVFLLMLRSDSVGSIYTLGKKDKIIGVRKRGDRNYSRPYSGSPPKKSDFK